MGLHERAAELYGDSELVLSSGDYPDTSGIETAFDNAVKWLHGKRVFGAAMLREKVIDSLVKETAAFLSEGIRQGLEESTISDAMAESLRESVGVFSGFKTFHEMKEAAGMLLDEAGNIKPFEQYYKDIQTLNDTYNKFYLKAEYDFTVSSSTMAARWEEQQDDGDGRYLLQYRTAGDNKVRKAHRELEGITLPSSDPFWDKYYPPNGWRCRCTVAKVRAAKYPVTDSRQAVDAAEKATAGKHAEMFRFNPGKQRAVYPAYNSYTISECNVCPKSDLKLAGKFRNELCAACQIIREQAKFITEPTKGGELRVHIQHGKNEREENIRIARHFTDKYGQEIDLLPRSNTEKCADAYNRTLKQLQEYKQCATPTKNAIDMALRDANRKADHIVLVIASDISEELLTKVIRERMLRVKRLQSITIVKDGKEIVYTKEETIRKKFKINWADLK